MIIDLLITDKTSRVIYVSNYYHYSYFTKGDMLSILANKSKKLFNVRRANTKASYISKKHGEIRGYIVSFYIDVLNKGEKWLFAVEKDNEAGDFDMIFKSITAALKTVKEETNLIIYGTGRIYHATIAPKPKDLYWGWK